MEELDGKWNVNQDILTQAPYFRFSPDGTPTKAKRNMEEDRFPYPNFGWLCHTGWPIHMRGLRGQRVLLMKALPAVHKEETPWDFLSGTLPWLHRYHQGHQNISTFVTCSLLPNSEFGSFMITPSGFVSLKLDLGLFFPPYIPVFPRVCIFRFDTKNPVFQNNRMLPLRNPLTITEKGIGKMHPVPSPFKTMTVLLHLGLEHSWKTMC